MMENILVLASPTPADPNFYKRWEQVGHVSRRCLAGNPENSRYTVLVVDFRYTFDPKDAVKDRTYLNLKEFPNVKWVCSATTGEDHLAAIKGKVNLVTLKGETEFLLKNITSVSEFTLQMMLSLSRPLDGMGVVLRNKVVGIVGLGRIGKHVLKRCLGFEMQPITWDKGDNRKRLECLLKESDYVTLHLELNEDTRHIMKRYEFSLMKPSAAFINTARGGLVDEKALAWALKNGVIAAATVDVIDNPRILNASVPNLIVTPHVAGCTLEDRIATDEFIVKKLRRLIHAH